MVEDRMRGEGERWEVWEGGREDGRMGWDGTSTTDDEGRGGVLGTGGKSCRGRRIYRRRQGWTVRGRMGVWE